MEDLYKRRDKYKRQRNIVFMIFIACIIFSLICGADSFGKVSTWFWIMSTVAAFIALFPSNRNYEDAVLDCVDRYKEEKEKELREIEKEAKAAQSDTMKYRHEAEALRKEKDQLLTKNDLLLKRVAEVAVERDTLKARIDNYVNDRIKEWNTVEPEQADTLASEKTSVEAVDVDKIIEDLVEVEIVPVFPAPQKQIVYEPLKLKSRYPISETVINGDFVVCDLETTGLSPEADEIIEISAVRFRRFKAESAFSSLLNPNRMLPAIITQITGLTDEDLRNAPKIEEIFNAFVEYVGNDALVGHNLKGFDLKFLHRIGFDKNNDERLYFDTLSISKYLIPKTAVKNHKLPTLLEHYNIVRSVEHRGLADSVATGLLFQRLLQEANNRGVLYQI